ncbi:MAG: hypothetical protein IJ617_02725 [Oscillospiraceae bacterium]|nr:hypothetical protein [Oscillospiraceae bacterium]
MSIMPLGIEALGFRQNHDKEIKHFQAFPAREPENARFYCAIFMKLLAEAEKAVA